MSGEAPFPFLRETLLFLTLAGVLIPLLQRLRFNQVLGFLVVGIVVGPYGLGRLSHDWPWLGWLTFPRLQGVSVLAELGVIFLMFLIGLELSAPRMWAMRAWVFGAGLAQIVLTAALIGGVARAFGNPPVAALVLGLVFSLSSTAVVVQLLAQRRALATPMGQAAFAVLMLQDLAVVPLLILIDVLASKAEPEVGWLLGMTVLKSTAVIGLIFVLGRRVIGPLFRLFSRHRQPEVFMALTLLTALSIAGATAAAGLSMALGALLAGLLLAETEYRHEVEVTIEPFKGLLLGLFFMSVGMGIDPRAIARDPLWIGASVVGLFAIKGLVATGVFRAARLPWGQALDAGLLLGQGGEFAFVVIGAAMASGLLRGDVGQFMLLVVSASLLVTPAVAQLAQRAGEWLDRRRTPAAEPGAPLPAEGLSNHVIVAGCGRVGQLLADVFTRQRVPFVGVEHDAHLVARLRARGLPVVYGNAARPELLRKLQAGRAAGVVITMDQPAAAMHTVRAIRSEFATLPVFARCRDERHARELLDAGATIVVPETLEAALQLAGSTLHHLGLAEAEVLRAIDAERERRTDPQSERTHAPVG